MKRPKPPLFLERGSYRRRRLADAAKVLPVLAMLLFMVPLLWAPQDTVAPDTARGSIYVFLVWAGLILCAFALSRRIVSVSRRAPRAHDEEGA